MAIKHLDEASRDALEGVRQMVEPSGEFLQAVLIDDIKGGLRLILWSATPLSEPVKTSIQQQMRDWAGPYWTGDLWIASQAEGADAIVYKEAWDQARPVSGKVRFLRRWRSHVSWFEHFQSPPWKSRGQPDGDGPPIIGFYSFKGGVGRTTAAASFAIQRSRLGERVVVIDLDLDAPGIGVLLAADEAGTVAPWGLVDYLLEAGHAKVELRDYFHACRREIVTGSGEILVFPSGRLDEDYLGKLSRIDFDVLSGSGQNSLVGLLNLIREQLSPHWVLLDTRAGLSEPAGILMTGLAHMHVLFGTSSEQSWAGLQVILRRIGAERVLKNLAQLDCLLVQTMVPEDTTVSQNAMRTFLDRARDEFSEHYYAPDPEDVDEESFWYVRDLEDKGAPHFPVALPYQPKLAHFKDIADVSQVLAEGIEYRELAERIETRFREVVVNE